MAAVLSVLSVSVRVYLYSAFSRGDKKLLRLHAAPLNWIHTAYELYGGLQRI